MIYIEVAGNFKMIIELIVLSCELIVGARCHFDRREKSFLVDSV